MCSQTLLRASTLSRHTPQASSLAFLMPCLRIQEEKSRELSSGYTQTHKQTQDTHTRHTHRPTKTQTNFTSCCRAKCSHFNSYNNSNENKSAYSKHLQASSTVHKDSARLQLCGVKTNNTSIYIFLLLRKKATWMLQLHITSILVSLSLRVSLLSSAI